MEGTDIIALSGTLLGGTAIAPAVDALKDAGLPTKFCKLAAIVVGAGLGALAGVITGALEVIAVTSVAGLVSGLMSSRNYDAAKTEGNLEGFDQAKSGKAQPEP